MNPFTAVGQVKPGPFRKVTINVILYLLNAVTPPLPEAGRPRRREDDPLRALALPERPASGAVREQLRRQPRELHGRLHRQDFLGVEPRLHQRDRLPTDALADQGRLHGTSSPSRIICGSTRRRRWSGTRHTVGSARRTSRRTSDCGKASTRTCGGTASGTGSRRCDPRARRHPGALRAGLLEPRPGDLPAARARGRRLAAGAGSAMRWAASRRRRTGRSAAPSTSRSRPQD